MDLFALFGINPASWVTSFVTAMFKDALGAIGTAASDVLAALLGFMNATTEPVFSSGWWSSSGEQVFERVLGVAGSLMFIGFAISVISSVLSHDHTVMAKAALHLPLAVIEMAALVTVTAALISGSDELATYIAGGGSKGLTAFVTTTLAVAVTTGGLVGILLAGFIIVAGLLVWAVLIVRTALIYVAVMTGPLIFASSIHPATRHVRKRYVEGGIALIGSKVIMAIAFATGSAMLGGITSSPSFADAIGALMQALAILLIAAFAPFIFIKLLIAAEALGVAEGIERRPLRAGMSGASGVYHAAGLKHMMGRLGGGGSGASGDDSGDPGGGPGGGSSNGTSGGGGWRRATHGNVARAAATARRAAGREGAAKSTSPSASSSTPSAAAANPTSAGSPIRQPTPTSSPRRSSSPRQPSQSDSPASRPGSGLAPPISPSVGRGGESRASSGSNTPSNGNHVSDPVPIAAAASDAASRNDSRSDGAAAQPIMNTQSLESPPAFATSPLPVAADGPSTPVSSSEPSSETSGRRSTARPAPPRTPGARTIPTPAVGAPFGTPSSTGASPHSLGRLLPPGASDSEGEPR